MSLASKLGVGFAALVALMAALAAYQLRVVEQLRRDSREISQISFAALQLASRLRSDVSDLGEFSEKWAILRDEAYFETLRRIRSEIEAGLASLDELELSPAEEDERHRLAASWDDYLSAIPPRDARLESGEEAPATYRRDVELRMGELELALTTLIGASRGAMAERAAASELLARRSLMAAAAATAAAALAALAIGWWIYRSFMRPLRHLVGATRELAEGNFEHRVTADGGAELAQVGESFNEMAGRLSELDRVKREFVANLSHDLKAPLDSMIEGTRFLLEDPQVELGTDQRRLLHLNLQSGARLSELLQNLLDLARFDARAMEYRREVVDLRDPVRSAVAGLTARMEEGGLAPSCDLPPEPVEVEGDPRYLTRVVENLLSNAVRFTPRGGRIGIRVTAESGLDGPFGSRSSAGVEVWDTGPGVPDERKSTIFGRFSRGEGGGRDGTGLGLAIVAAVVGDHGGRVSVVDREGGGSRFLVVLPRAVAGPRRAASRRESGAPV